MPKVQKAGLDAATEQQAIASAQWLIKLRGGLTHEYSQDYWRFSTKAELCGHVATNERFLQGIKNALKEHGGEVSIYFLPGLGKWNGKLAAKLIPDAKQGDADADQVLREVAAEHLQRRTPLPDELADYVAACLQQTNSSKAQSDEKAQSHKTDYRDWILALTVDDVARHFNLDETRNEATEEHCACSIVAEAADLHENTVQNAWHRYQDIADKRTATNYVTQAMVSVTANGAQRHFTVRFPRVGSPDAMPKPKPRRSRKA